LLPDPWVVDHQVWLAALATRDDAQTEQRTSDPFSLGLQIVGPVPDLSDAAGVSIGEA
jgi:hypothetical protein